MENEVEMRDNMYKDIKDMDLEYPKGAD